jgi:hypothetical protein
MIRAICWFLIDWGVTLVTLSVSVLACVAIVATPIWLGLIHRELTAMRAERAVCACRCDCDDDGPGPILPRVLPRLRRIGEEAGE